MAVAPDGFVSPLGGGGGHVLGVQIAGGDINGEQDEAFVGGLPPIVGAKAAARLRESGAAHCGSV